MRQFYQIVESNRIELFFPRIGMLYCSYRKIRRLSTILHREYNAEHDWYLSKSDLFSAPCLLSYWNSKYKTIEKNNTEAEAEIERAEYC